MSSSRWKSVCFALLIISAASAQDPAPAPAATPSSPQQQSPAPTKSAPAQQPSSSDSSTAQKQPDASKQQPHRILGIMPNYRAVSAGAIPPPPTPKEAFKIATQNSFDYSSFLFVGLTSFEAEASGAHPKLGTGIDGFGHYYWRGFLDKTDGNYLVICVMPTIFHQDERYYAMGEGPFFKRVIYSASRTLITPNYHGHPSFNASELLGRGAAQAISAAYYPSSDRTLGALAVKYGWAIGRDTAVNVFREFWPDIATHVLHRHP